MDEDLTVSDDSAKNCSISLIEDEKEKVKDFVYKHFREVTDGSLFNNAEESAIKDHGNSVKKDKQSFNKAPCKIQQGAVFSGKILSFGCCVCKDDSTYSPNDLLKHFRVSHKGTLPTYPCDLCSFVTNEFPVLQRHRIEHRNTLVTCELCNDGVQYSLLLLTRHYIMCHSLNGQFHCDWCEFTTVDAGTFVQHIHHHNESPWKCSKCSHISLNEEDHQKHVKAHSSKFPFTCQICGYGAARNENLKKHTAAVHKKKAEKRNAWKAVEDDTPANSSASLKFLLKKTELQEAQRMSKLNCLSGNLQNGRLIQPDLGLEETQHIVDGNAAKKDNKNGSKGSHSTDQSTSLMLHECDNSSGSDSACHNSPNGLTVLMVKNKISLPPNCTTKVMGFKMVDGKKHLVLKVIPTAKQDSSTQNHSSVDDLGSSASNPTLDKGIESVDNAEGCDGRSSSVHGFALSGSESCLQMDQDIMAVKVKIEEEETCVSNFDPIPHKDCVREKNDPLLNRSSTCTDMFDPTTNEVDHINDQSLQNHTTCSQFDDADASSRGSSKTSKLSTCAGKVTAISKSSKAVQGKLLSKQISRITENCGAEDELLADSVADKFLGKHKENSSFNTAECSTEPSQRASVRSEIKLKNDKNVSPTPAPLSESSTITSGSDRETTMGLETHTHNSPNQEVFSFHNYSKETFSTSPNTTHSSDNESEPSDNESVCESSSFNECTEPFKEPVPDLAEEKNHEDVRKVSDGDVEVECIPSDYDFDEEHSESVLQDFNIIKVEEESIPISRIQSETRNSSLGSFVEEHSDAIITQQLNKERVGSLEGTNDSCKQTKTTLRILQLPEGKKPVLLRTSENRFAVPMQVKSSPGFKLITNSAHPQINVSYTKPGMDTACNPKCVTPTANSRRVGVSVPAEKGATLLSAVQPGANATSNHYFINSPGFKGPVLLSSTPHNTLANKMAKAQPTCYLVQRSLPLVQAPTAPGLRLASTQLQLNSRPVLAMPVGSADKTSALQPGRQAFLLRYISPPKSGLLLNSPDGKSSTQCSQVSESTGNKVIFKIVSPTGSRLSSSTPTSNSQPLFLATTPQTQCFLVSSNKTNPNASNGLKKFITIQNSAQKNATDSCISAPQMNGKLQPGEADKPILAPRPIRPPSQRKRRRKMLFDELPLVVQKARRLAHKAAADKETTVLWKPVAKEVERTLRLSPFSSQQQIKCPRRYQPVVVLNHPDADIPEAANIMRVVNRYKGAVTKVSLSQKTVQALLELGALRMNSSASGSSSHSSSDPRPRPVHSSVRERFLLRLKLRKKSRKKYEVVETFSGCRQESAAFDCWFCGRLFKSQEDWIGHGQRHLMEATRDWNKLF